MAVDASPDQSPDTNDDDFLERTLTKDELADLTDAEPQPVEERYS